MKLASFACFKIVNLVSRHVARIPNHHSLECTTLIRVFAAFSPCLWDVACALRAKCHQIIQIEWRAPRIETFLGDFVSASSLSSFVVKGKVFLVKIKWCMASAQNLEGAPLLCIAVAVPSNTVRMSLSIAALEFESCGAAHSCTKHNRFCNSANSLLRNIPSPSVFKNCTFLPVPGNQAARAL